MSQTAIHNYYDSKSSIIRLRMNRLKITIIETALCLVFLFNILSPGTCGTFKQKNATHISSTRHHEQKYKRKKNKNHMI